jgi:4-diphosphocytidyl-2-C-methyl-D-erythritol kinase
MANLPADRRNTAYKAAAAFSQAAGLSQPIQIYIEKHIPVAAGLAGGSADAAAVLRGLSKLCPGLLTPARIHDLAARIGADVPFCLAGGTALCEGIGDILTPLEPFDRVPLILLKPGFGLSTSWSYAQFDQTEPALRPSQDRVCAALARHNLGELAGATANVLESVAFIAHPVLAELKNELLAAGAVVALMSGSGPTLYGLFADEGSRDAGFSRLAAKMPASVLLLPARTLASGPYSGVN